MEAIKTVNYINQTYGSNQTLYLNIDPAADAGINCIIKILINANFTLNTNNTINDRVYGDITDEEELYAYKKKIARELMKKQQEAFYKKQTKIL